MTANVHKGAVDPVTLSVVWSRLLSIARETTERVMYSAQSWVMANAKDVGAVLLNPEGQILTQVEVLPCHSLLAEVPTKVMLDKFGKLDPGDFVLGNDGHIVKSGHLPDWTFLSPMYWHDELLGYVHMRGHMADSGGAYTGGYWPRGYDCIAEGINIPPVKIIEKGKVNEELYGLILRNVRNSPVVRADNMVIHGSMERAGEAVCELVDKYGLDTVRACFDEVMRAGEEAMRKEIRQFREGVYTGEAAVDWDGTTPDRLVWIRVKLTIKGDEMVFDFSDSMDQVDFVNSPLGNTYAYTYLGLFLSMDSTIPHNHGALVPITIIAPEGKVVNPTYPHTYGACALACGIHIYEACLQALGKANPEKTPAPWSRPFTPNPMGRLPMIDPRTGVEVEYFAAPFIEGGGGGAIKGYDGWPGYLSAGGVGSLIRGSVENIEMFVPFRWNCVELRQDSEGPGEFRGCAGLYCERECLAPEGARTWIMSGSSDGQETPIAGQAGAPPAPLPSMYFKRVGKEEREHFRCMDLTEVNPGDVLITYNTGGAGWGDPLDRDVEKVRKDVKEGIVSIERARDIYGVLIDGESLEVDYKATEQLRKKGKAKK